MAVNRTNSRGFVPAGHGPTHGGMRSMNESSRVPGSGEPYVFAAGVALFVIPYTDFLDGFSSTRIVLAGQRLVVDF